MAASVGYVLPDVARQITKWRKIKDCIEGSEQVKSRSDKYLPIPNAKDNSPENKARYAAYIKRAVFYNVLLTTLGGLQGQLFKRDPTIEVPADLDPLLKNADGTGVQLSQLAAGAARRVIAFGRSGLYVDYPKTEGKGTLADQQKGKLQAIFSVYAPWDIINWRVEAIGSKKYLTLVVLRERYKMDDSDDFIDKYGTQYRVLKLVDGKFVISIYRSPNQIDINPLSRQEDDWYFGLQFGPGSRGVSAEAFDESVPIDANGKPFDYIPFTFIGSENNDETVDDAPLYDLAELNLGHYCNSADYEEACYLVGQPTLVLAGLAEEWATKVLKGKVLIGSRAAIPLPVGGTAELLQAQPNTLPKEAMDAKEIQMLAIGAKLIQPSQGQRTATEANIDNVAETSALGNIAKNISNAFAFALGVACQYMGVDPKFTPPVAAGEAPKPVQDIKFKVNTDFDVVALAAPDRAQLQLEWQNGAITFGEMRGQLRGAGVATESDERAKEQIDTEQAAQVQALVAQNKAQGLDPSGQVPLTPDPNKTPPKN